MRIRWSYCLATAAAFAMAVLLVLPSANAQLIVTGVFDGPLDGGEPKVVELFAKADIPDLSLFAAGAANNGGGTDGPELTLSGSASMGDYLYIVDDNSDSAFGVEFNDYFGFTPALIFDSNTGSFGGPAAINGDDAIEVFSDPSGLFSGAETVIDTFGDRDVDGTGTTWEYLDSWAYRIDNTGPDGSTFVEANWTFPGINVNDGKATNVGPDAFPIGTYRMSAVVPEPASFVLALVGLMGLAATRRSRK